MNLSSAPAHISFRPIEAADNEAIAFIIRTTLTEFGANKPGTVYFDATTDQLFELFQNTSLSAYYVAIQNNTVVGGGGIFPTEGLPPETCELVKMYLSKEVRGLGAGKRLIETCLSRARQSGYQQVYLETMPELKNALHVYQKLGFEYLTHPMGNTGHFGCELWMLKKL